MVQLNKAIETGHITTVCIATATVRIATTRIIVSGDGFVVPNRSVSADSGG
jgi:hypothetical protein